MDPTTSTSSPDAEEAAEPAGPRHSRVRDVVVPVVATYLASRAVAFSALWLGQRAAGRHHLYETINGWDSGWYLSVAIVGYPNFVPTGSGISAQSRIAFFPGLPMLVDILSSATGMHEMSAGLIIVTIGGLAATLSVALFAREFVARKDAEADDTAAIVRAATLFAFFPGSYALSLVYPEGWFIACSIGALVALRHRWWAAAGLLAAGAGLLRPNGLALTACCAWAAVFAIRDRREWQAALAPLLAPLGTIGYFVFLWRRTGEPLAWVKAQDAGWSQTADFGASALRAISDVATSPLADVNRIVQVGSLAAVLVGAFALWRLRVDVPTWIFVASVVVPVVISSAFPITPRTVLTAAPLVVAIAIVFDRAYGAIVGSAAVLLGAFLIIATTSLALTP